MALGVPREDLSVGHIAAFWFRHLVWLSILKGIEGNMMPVTAAEMDPSMSVPGRATFG